MKKVLSILNPKRYSYSKEKKEEYLVYDMRFCNATFSIIILINILKFIAYSINSELRIDKYSGFDSLKLTTFMFISAVLGLTFLLVTRRIKNRKI